MIWTIVSKEEMEGYNIPPVFQYYREVIGKDNIKLVVVEDNDTLDFIKPDDIVLLRTASNVLVETIKNKGVRSTAEEYCVYSMAQDKKALGAYLSARGVLVPTQYTLDEVRGNHTYFVKPRFGSESFGISSHCICSSKKQVTWQIEQLGGISKVVIEDFIDGVDCTVACYYDSSKKDFMTYAIKVECDEIGNIQTHEGKFQYNEYCSALNGKEKEIACDTSKKICELIGVKHHARIDYRLDKNGDLFLIDVNLLPGLGPSAHFAKCLLLTENLSYKDAIKKIIQSASI